MVMTACEDIDMSTPTPAEAAKSIVQLSKARQATLHKYDFHMAQVRKGQDADLIKAHLAAAQREYDAAVLLRDNADRIIDAVLRS
jgi:stress response protein SCP2